MTTVVNKTHEPYDVYIGRGSIFGNPYVIGRDGTREQVIARYEEWFKFLIRDSKFVAELKSLKGKKLGCFCSPLLCHGHIIADYVNSLESDCCGQCNCHEGEDEFRQAIHDYYTEEANRASEPADLQEPIQGQLPKVENSDELL